MNWRLMTEVNHTASHLWGIRTCTTSMESFIATIAFADSKGKKASSKVLWSKCVCLDRFILLLSRQNITTCFGSCVRFVRVWSEIHSEDWICFLSTGPSDWLTQLVIMDVDHRSSCPRVEVLSQSQASPIRPGLCRAWCPVWRHRPSSASRSRVSDASHSCFPELRGWRIRRELMRHLKEMYF